MKKMLVALAALATLATGFAVPANASPAVTVHAGPHGSIETVRVVHRHRIGPNEAARIARRHGFTRIYSVRSGRDAYLVRAARRHGPMATVVIDAHGGRILAVRPVRHPPRHI